MGADPLRSVRDWTLNIAAGDSTLQNPTKAPEKILNTMQVKENDK